MVDLRGEGFGCEPRRRGWTRAGTARSRTNAARRDGLMVDGCGAFARKGTGVVAVGAPRSMRLAFVGAGARVVGSIK